MHENTIPFEQLEAHMRAHVREVTGSDDISGVTLSALLRVAANLFDNLSSDKCSGCDLSGPRLGLLMRLYGEERLGKGEGLTPTDLSRRDNVSKNTTSSHLRGLEEQGLITRQIDAQDKRLFRIRLTDAGRALVQTSAPGHIRRLNQMTEVLSLEEQAQLNTLLKKLIASLAKNHSPLSARKAAG
jgi:DNA-binding MarR family transcriptional regulator